MIQIIENNDVYDVIFPYNKDIVLLIKNVPGKAWNPALKKWTIPKDRLGWFLNELKGTPYEGSYTIQSSENIDENATLDDTQTIPDIEVTGYRYKVKEGSKPFQHQLDFMKYAVNRQNIGIMSGFIIGDDPGLAKTNESMNLALYNRKFHNFKHCLVICCINTSKYNWQNDIYEHTRGSERPYILGSRIARNGDVRCDTGTKEKLEDLQSGHMYGKKKYPKLPYFIVMNVEGLRGKVGRSYVIADEIIKLIKAGEINTVIIDEAHKNLSPTSSQGKQLLKIKKQTGMKCMWLPMTGTPITNKPTDVFLALRLVDAHDYNSFYTFSQQYCIFGGFGGHDIIGYKNIPRLKHMLQSNMIRRLKEKVTDLPPKIYYTEYVENTPYQQKLYNEIANELRTQRTEVVTSMNPLAKFMRLRQVNGAPEIIDKGLEIDNSYLSKNAKLSRILEIIDDIVESGEKVLVFSNWVEPLRTLYKFVSKKHKTCCFTGTMSEEEREKHKRVFQNNPEYKVMIGTIGAMGTTHTLTAAQNVLFYDEPWVPTDKQQAEDRAHRIGTTKSIRVITVITRGSVDERVHDIIYGKDLVSKYIVDGKLDIRSNPELFDMLLGDTKNKPIDGLMF